MTHMDAGWHPTSQRRPGSRLKIVVWTAMWLLMSSAWNPGGVSGQEADPPGDSVAAPDIAAAALPELPIFLTLGMAYGMRSDPCTQCPAPENTESFSGHLSVGRYLAGGLGVGLDASVWRRGHPGPLGPADSTGVPVATSLSNMLGNASLVFSYQVWHVFVRAGGGVAWGSQDMEKLDSQGDATVTRASGMGIGYTVGGGFTLPVASMVSLAFFGNWNVGQYDLTSAAGVIERDSKHEYLEVGVGVTIR